MGGVQPVVPRGQPHLPTRNRTMGNPAKLHDGVPVIKKVIDLMSCREAGGGRKNTSNVPDCIRFATWNIGTMSGKSAEVVETLHRRKIDVCCSTRKWTGSAAGVMGKGMSRYKFFRQGCKDGNARVGLFILAIGLTAVVELLCPAPRVGGLSDDATSDVCPTSVCRVHRA